MKLTPTDIKVALASLNGWAFENNAIHKQYVKRDFVIAMGFANSVALLAERAGHHPDMLVRWNRVDLTLSTHDAGGVTDKDIALATEIEAL